MNTLPDRSVLLDGLKQGLQEKVGSTYLIERVLDATPVMTEVVLLDRATRQHFCARIYNVRPENRSQLKQLWQIHAGSLEEASQSMPQPSYGLKAMGEALVHVGEHIPGVDLATYLENTGQCHPTYAVRLISNLVKFLEPLAAQGIHHHHIKPCDVVLTADGFSILKNTGLAPFEAAIAESLSLPDLIEAGYAAPEQLSGEPASVATDIYQLGLLLFHMVTGQLPFEGNYEAVKEGHLKKGLPNPQTLNSEVGVGLARVLVKALAKKPEHRFHNFEDFKKTLSFMLPASERAALDGAGSFTEPTGDDLVQVGARLKEAAALCNQGNYQAALQTMDAVLMASGPVKQAISLHRKIWEIAHKEQIEEFFRSAVEQKQQNQIARSLWNLNRLLSLQPHHLKALEFQNDLFENLSQKEILRTGILPLKAYLGKAAEAKSIGHRDLAEALWFQVLTAQPGGEEPVPFEKQMAAREWETLHAPQAAPATIPEPEEPEETLAEPEMEMEAATLPPEPLPDQEQIAVPTQKKKKSLLIPILALVGVVVLAGLAFFGMRYKAAKAYQAEAEQAYARADALESAGEWDQALLAWGRVVADFPNHEDSEYREKNLQYKIQERQNKIREHIAQAQSLVESGVLMDESGDNAVFYLRKVLNEEPENPEARALLQTIRDSEMARAKELFEQKKVMEAKDVYDQLLSIDPGFADEELGGKIQVWVEDNLINPELAKLDRAIRRKNWDQAFSISEGLEAHAQAAVSVRERWDAVFADYQAKYDEALQKGKEETMLSILQIMTRIRPEDQTLADQRNKLSRDLNLSKIVNMEKDINRNMDRGNLIRAGQLSNSLLSLDSENEVAKNALSNVRRQMVKKIETLKKTNPREALDHYRNLIKVFNWKSYRTEMTNLGKLIENFDKKVLQLKKAEVASYQERKDALARLRNANQSFIDDPQYQWMIQHEQALDRENQRLAQLLRWESGAENDVRLSFNDILKKLGNEPSFQFLFGMKELARLKNKYRDYEDNYRGNVTLVIRGAQDLPKEKSGINRAPEAFCELKTSGKTFTTGVVNNRHDPSWGYTCTYQVQPGSPLVFTIFDEDGRKNEPLGQVKIDKVPKNGKNLTFKSPDGWTLVLDIRRER